MAILIYLGVAYISIFIHECGHYLSAYFFGVKATDVVTGMGYPLFKFKTKHTVFTFKLFPGGGMTSYNEGDLENLSPLQSIITLVSGIVLNYLTATIAMSFYLKTSFLIAIHSLNQLAINFIFNIFRLINVKDIFFPEASLTDSVQKIASANSTLSFVFFLFVFMNLVLFMFNLLPIPFFDGGQIIGIIFDPILIRLGFSHAALQRFKSFINRLAGAFLMILIFMPFFSHCYYQVVKSPNPVKQLTLYALILIFFLIVHRLLKNRPQKSKKTA